MKKLQYLVILVLTASIALTLESDITRRWLVREIGDTVLDSQGCSYRAIRTAELFPIYYCSDAYDLCYLQEKLLIAKGKLATI